MPLPRSGIFCDLVVRLLGVWLRLPSLRTYNHKEPSAPGFSPKNRPAYAGTAMLNVALWAPLAWSWSM